MRQKTIYGIQLGKKQQLKEAYGYASERQMRKDLRGFKNRLKQASQRSTEAEMESRLCVITHRVGIGSTKNECRQLISHGHVYVNGKPITVAGIKVKAGDLVGYHGKNPVVLERLKDRQIPDYMARTEKANEFRMIRVPTYEDLPDSVKEMIPHVIEFYSR